MTKSEAQKKIRNHLDTRSNHSVVVTERMARIWWRVCNVALFRNKLYPPGQLVIKQLKDWGYCQITSELEVIIALDSEITTRGMFLSTLIHEMVHQWENQTYGRMGHGERFSNWKKKILKELSLDIHIEADEEDYAYGEKQLYKRRH